MSGIANFIFNNIFIIIILIVLYYLFTEYKDLKDKAKNIYDVFDKSLSKYLDKKVQEAKNIANGVLLENNEDEVLTAEVSRLLLMIDKEDASNTINEKVEISNSLNKFKLSKKIDFEKYPFLLELNNVGTFTEEDMESLENGIALARKEYNARAFRYNEKATGFPMQYLTKILKLPQRFTIFEAPKYEKYEEKYEVFEENEPEINFLSSLNRSKEDEPEEKKENEKKD